MCKTPNSFVNSARLGQTAYLNVKCVYVPWARWCLESTCAIQAHWPRRGAPRFPPSLLIPKGSNHYKQALVSVLLVLTQQGPLKAGFRGAWPRDAAVTRTSKQAGKALRSQGHHYARVM